MNKPVIFLRNALLGSVMCAALVGGAARHCLAASYNAPTGIYTASGVTLPSNNPMNDSTILGGLVRAQWNQIETGANHSGTPNNWNWTPIDQQVDTIECNQICYSGKVNGVCSNNLASQGRSSCTAKKWSLSVAGGPTSPSWLYQGSGNLGVTTFQITVQGSTLTIPKFWDTTLLSRLGSLATALGQRYGNDPNLQLVYIPQMTENGVEGQFNGVSTSTLTNAGLTINNWVSAVEQTTQNFAVAFPSTSIAAEQHYMLGSSCAGLRIMYDISAGVNAYAGRSVPAIQQIGTATWWLDGATNYQGDLIKGTSYGDPNDQITNPTGDPNDQYGWQCKNEQMQSGGFQGFIQAGGRVYAQAIAQSGTPGSYPSGYPAIFTQAEGLGMKYIEVWQQDVGTSWDSYFSSFNSYAGD